MGSAVNMETDEEGEFGRVSFAKSAARTRVWKAASRIVAL
jgi:hypothetical protein